MRLSERTNSFLMLLIEDICDWCAVEGKVDYAALYETLFTCCRGSAVK